MSGDRDVGLREVVALEQERLAARAGERVDEAIAEVEPRRMTAPLAEIAIGGAGDLGLLAGHRLDDDADLGDGFVKAPAGDRASSAVDDDGGFEVVGPLFKAAADGAPRKTLIVNVGYDSTAEEAFLFSGAAALERGYNALLFDGPGQGAAIFEEGLVFRPDWEKVIGPVVRACITRIEIAKTELAFGWVPLTPSTANQA